jgi:hypothetical protein
MAHAKTHGLRDPRLVSGQMRNHAFRPRKRLMEKPCHGLAPRISRGLVVFWAARRHEGMPTYTPQSMQLPRRLRRATPVTITVPRRLGSRVHRHSYVVSSLQSPIPIPTRTRRPACIAWLLRRRERERASADHAGATTSTAGLNGS